MTEPRYTVIVHALLLGHDEGDAGAVWLQGGRPLPGAEVKHGQGGEGSHTAALRHAPQLVPVPVDGVVVIQLDPAGGDRGEALQRTVVLVVETEVRLYRGLLLVVGVGSLWK